MTSQTSVPVHHTWRSLVHWLDTAVPVNRFVRLRLETLEDRLAPALGNPTWVAQGPAPITNPVDTYGSPNDGAINAIAADATNAANVFIGSVNGGVWRSTNANNPNAPPTWTPLTDTQQPGLRLHRGSEHHRHHHALCGHRRDHLCGRRRRQPGGRL